MNNYKYKKRSSSSIMAFICSSSSKRRPLLLFLIFFISFTLIFFNSTFFHTPSLSNVIHLSNLQASFHEYNVKQPKWLKVILEMNSITPHHHNRTLKFGLINFNDHDQSNLNLKGTIEYVPINFEYVSSNVTWKKLFPEWVDERKLNGRCPQIPMPELGKYSELDVVVARLPCMEVEEEIDANGHVWKSGIRDVHRLQISLASAHVLVENGISQENNKDVYVVFIGNCEPMVELFRCEDLVWHEEEYWMYKPNVEKLMEMIRMPVGGCAIPLPYATRNPGSRQLQAKAKAFSHELQILARSQSIYAPREAYVTVLHSSETYVCGAIALAQSILQTDTTKDLVLLADHTISYHSVLSLQAAGWKVKRIDRIMSPNAKKDDYNKWNYSKLRIWQLVEYDKLIFIDSDFIVLQNIDHFFNYPQLSASPNNRWLFNSGIMVLEPSECFFDYLMNKRHTIKSYNGGDQGYLNEVVTWWHRLTLKLNFLKHFPEGSGERLVPKDRYTIHYLGMKPWLCYRDYDCNWDWNIYHIFASDDAHAKWWQVYDSMPKKLQKYCGMTRKQDEFVRKRKVRAQKANYSDGHWKIEIKDPRQFDLIGPAEGKTVF